MRGKARPGYAITEEGRSLRRAAHDRNLAKPDVMCPNGCGNAFRPIGLSKHLRRCVDFACVVDSCERTSQGARGMCGFHYGIEKSVRAHGLTVITYLKLYEDQQGRCAICNVDGLNKGHGLGNKDKNLVLCIDHDHETGQVRALICHPCNVALGLMKDDSTRLRAAADYLDRFTHREMIGKSLLLNENTL